MLPRRTFTAALGSFFALVFAPFAAKAAKPLPPAPAAPSLPTTYTPTEGFWEYLSLARPELAPWLKVNMQAAHAVSFDVTYSATRFGLRLAGVAADMAPVPVRQHLDRQVTHNDVFMVFSGSPDIFNAPCPPMRQDFVVEPGAIFYANPASFVRGEESRVMAVTVTWREGFKCNLRFANGLILHLIDTDELRTWYV